MSIQLPPLSTTLYAIITNHSDEDLSKIIIDWSIPAALLLQSSEDSPGMHTNTLLVKRCIRLMPLDLPLFRHLWQTEYDNFTKIQDPHLFLDYFEELVKENKQNLFISLLQHNPSHFNAFCQEEGFLNRFLNLCSNPIKEGFAKAFIQQKKNEAATHVLKSWLQTCSQPSDFAPLIKVIFKIVLYLSLHEEKFLIDCLQKKGGEETLNVSEKASFLSILSYGGIAEVKNAIQNNPDSKTQILLCGIPLNEPEVLAIEPQEFVTTAGFLQIIKEDRLDAIPTDISQDFNTILNQIHKDLCRVPLLPLFLLAEDPNFLPILLPLLPHFPDTHLRVVLFQLDDHSFIQLFSTLFLEVTDHMRLLRLVSSEKKKCYMESFNQVDRYFKSPICTSFQSFIATWNQLKSTENPDQLFKLQMDLFRHADKRDLMERRRILFENDFNRLLKTLSTPSIPDHFTETFEAVGADLKEFKNSVDNLYNQVPPLSWQWQLVLKMEQLIADTPIDFAFFPSPPDELITDLHEKLKQKTDMDSDEINELNHISSLVETILSTRPVKRTKLDGKINI